MFHLHYSGHSHARFIVLFILHGSDDKIKQGRLEEKHILSFLCQALKGHF